MGFAPSTWALPKVAYVYATSMEPLLHRGDGFVVWSTRRLQVGDIILYRPTVLPAPYITHRIISIEADGYRTQGDNAPYADQASGEPLVSGNRIIGKVATLAGQPIRIPQLGRLVAMGRSRMAGLCILLGIGLLLTVPRRRRRRNPRRIAPVLTLGCMLSMAILSYWSAHEQTIPPGHTRPLPLHVHNSSVFPMLQLVSGARAVVLMPFEHKKIKVYHGSDNVRSEQLPLVLPPSALVWLHGQFPVATRVGVGLALGWGVAFAWRKGSRR